MNFDKADITDCAAALATNSISAQELLELQITQIKRRNDKLNCLIELNIRGARIAAKLSDQRRKKNQTLSILDGIAIAVKDNINVAGMATRNGSKFVHETTGDATIVATLRNSGAIIIGKSNMDECAIGGTTANPHFGPTLNPWNTEFVPGGSSGGSAAAVGGGFALAALGTDTLGSIRLPAAYCGLVGLKATHSLINMEGIISLCRLFDHVGPLCRSARDIRPFLDAMVPNQSYRWSECSSQRRLAGARIGILDCVPGSSYDPIITTAFHNAIRDMSYANADIVSVSLCNLDLNELRHKAFSLIESECAKILSESVRDHPEAYSNNLKSMLDYGRKMSEKQLIDAREKLAQAKLAIINLFEDIDFLATPTAPQMPFPCTEPAPFNLAEITGLANISGTPAISLPSGLAPTGFPLALQLMAPHYREAELINVAEDLERIWGRLSLPVS